KRESRYSAQHFVVVVNLVDHVFRTTNDQRTVWPDLRIEMRPRHRTPSALLAGLGHALHISGVEVLNRLAGGTRNVAQRVYANLQLVGRMAGASACLPVEVDEWPESPRIAADDRHHQRESEYARARERTRRAADTQPDRQWILHGARIHALARQF